MGWTRKGLVRANHPVIVLIGRHEGGHFDDSVRGAVFVRVAMEVEDGTVCGTGCGRSGGPGVEM